MTTILHVDDEAAVRSTVKLVLERKGFSVISAKNVKEAAESLQRKAAQVSGVIADIRLTRASNDNSGAVFAERVKKANPSLPVIIYSAYADQHENLVGDLILHKGGGNPARELSENLDAIQTLCEGYESDRFKYIKDELIRLKEKYRISESDFRTLVSVLPVYEIAQTALLQAHDAEERGATEPRVEIVGPDDPLGAKYSLANPVAIVVSHQPEDGAYIAELYASPVIYAYGDAKEDAVDALLESMRDDFQSLLLEPEKFSPSADLARFRRYLSSIFGSAS